MHTTHWPSAGAKTFVLAVPVALLACPAPPALLAAEPARLTTESLDAQLRDGMLVRLVHRGTGQILLRSDPDPVAFARFGDLLAGGDGSGSAGTPAGGWRSEVATQTDGAVSYRLTGPRGERLDVAWRADQATGDIVCSAECSTPGPIAQNTLSFAGIDIAQFAAVLPSRWGACEVIRAPATGSYSSQTPSQMCMSLFLFEGEEGSWAVALNDAEDLPKTVTVEASGQSAGLLVTAGSWEPARQRRLFPIRFQACAGSWRQLADRFAREWMEQGLGMTPLARQPEWIREIRASSMMHGWDLCDLDLLATRVIPSQTLLYVPHWRTDSYDYGYPTYTPNAAFSSWCARARAMGFHVAAHFNMHGVNKGMNAYVERFRPGMNPEYPGWAVRDPDTGLLMWSLDQGRSGHYYVSSCYRPWRDFFVREAVPPALAAGVDVIHLDESHTAMACPRENRDIVNVHRGNIALQRELREAYPDIALQGEAFNDINMRHSSFAQIDAAVSHPVAVHVFSHFAKFVTRPDGRSVNTDRDAYEDNGYKLPWGPPTDEGALEEMRGFQDFRLDPAPDLPRTDRRRSGYRGPGGVTAYLERGETARQLAVYLPDGSKRDVNVTHHNLREYAGGVLPGWLVYDETRLLGLDPSRTYRFGAGTMPQDEFHLSAAPPDFQMRRAMAGCGNAHYVVEFAANGSIGLRVPPAVGEVHANGRRLNVADGTARFDAAGETTLVAFGPAGPRLEPGWVNALPWYAGSLPLRQGDATFSARGTGFFHHAGARTVITGTLPAVAAMRLKGAVVVDPGAKNGLTGVVKINGTEVLRVENQDPPWPATPFDVDVSAFAGMNVLIELITEGRGGYNYGGWDEFALVVQ